MNQFLETGISLVLIFFIFSVITYVIQELIAVNLKYRSKMLWKSMAQLFDGFRLEGRYSLQKKLPTGLTPATDAFFAHAQIKSLQKDLKRLPAYIPSPNFAMALMDLVAQKNSQPQQDLYTNFKEGLKGFTNSSGNIFPVLKNLVDSSANVKELQKKIESWFNDYMNRVSGWYQSQIVFSVRLIAIALTLAFNVNIIKLVHIIYNNEQVRTAMVAIAEKVEESPTPINDYYNYSFQTTIQKIDSAFEERKKNVINDPVKLASIQGEKDSTLAVEAKKYTRKKIDAINSLTAQLGTSGIPLGWNANIFEEDIAHNNLPGWLLMLIGWGIGAGCIAMGAPFWFDMLAKLVNVRRSGIKPGKGDNKGA